MGKERQASIQREERQTTIAKLRQEQNAGGDVTYASAGNFLVIYRGGRDVYKNFGSWLDTDPLALAAFLDAKTGVVADKLNIDLSTSDYQVVVVDAAKGCLGLIASGNHLGRVDEKVGQTFEHTRKSTVFWGRHPKKLTPSIPNIYNSAVHEAIGHGIVQPAIMPQLIEDQDTYNEQFIGSLSEGTPVYIEHLALGVDSHKEYAQELLNSLGTDHMRMALLGVQGFIVDSENSESARKASTVRISETRVPFFNIPLSKICDPRWEEEFRYKFVHYTRGPSFNKFIIDTYGTEKFKQWVVGVNKENYLATLSKTMEVSIDEIQSGWKSEVLRKMVELVDSGQHSIGRIYGGDRTAKDVLEIIRKYS